jgi:hypothetical protein
VSPSDKDYTERERVVRVEIEIPLFGSEHHVGVMRDRLRSAIALKFPGARVTDIDQEPIDD